MLAGNSSRQPMERGEIRGVAIDIGNRRRYRLRSAQTDSALVRYPSE